MKQPTAAEKTRTPQANERRSRSRGSSNSAEQARLVGEAERLHSSQSENNLPYTDRELRTTIGQHANEQQMPQTSSPANRRVSSGPHSSGGSRRHQVQGPTGNRRPQLDLKRKNEDVSHNAGKRPCTTGPARNGRHRQRVMLDSFAPGEDRDRNDESSRPAQNSQWTALNQSATVDRNLPG